MVGVNLTKKDLESIQKLYSVRWSADIRNWKERNVDGCMWMVTAPDKSGSWVTKTGSCLSNTIYDLLRSIEVE